MVKRWLSTFVEQPRPAALQVVAEDLGERMRCSDGIGHQRGGAQPVESASAEAARERMLTAGNVPASAAIALCGQTTWTAWSCIARRPLAAAPAGAANSRTSSLFNGESFLHAVFTVARGTAVRVRLARSRGAASADAGTACSLSSRHAL